MMTKLLALLSILAYVGLSVSAGAVRLKSGPTAGPTFPTCVGTPAGATIVAPNGSLSYLGWNYSAQNPVFVALNGTVFTSPICGGVWRDNIDPNTIYFNNFAQEYTAFDQARQTRSEIVANVAQNAVPTYGKNTTYHDIFQIYVDSLTNVVGVEFTTLSQTHGADARYGPDIPPNPSNTINGVPVSATAVFSTNFSQASPGANLQVFSQVAWGQNIQNRGVFGGNPGAVIQGSPVSLGNFNTWHTIDKTENDGHGHAGRFLLSIDGSSITNYIGNTGFEFVDLLRTHGVTNNTFTGSISGTTLTVSGLSGSAISVNQYVNGLLGEVADGTQITGGSGTTWTVSVSQTVASTTMATTGAQPTNSYQKMGQYWGMFACNSTGPEPWCHYPPVGARFVGARKGEYQVYLNYNAISNSGISAGTATSGVPYSQSLTLVRGSSSTGTPVYAIASGSVPGLSINSSTGVYSGTPTTPGSYVVTFTVTDDQSTTDSLPITITVS